jgi:hypothetical protein
MARDTGGDRDKRYRTGNVHYRRRSGGSGRAKGSLPGTGTGRLGSARVEGRRECNGQARCPMMRNFATLGRN